MDWDIMAPPAKNVSTAQTPSINKIATDIIRISVFAPQRNWGYDFFRRQNIHVYRKILQYPRHPTFAEPPHHISAATRWRPRAKADMEGRRNVVTSP
jgi:hypothetical protein